MTRRSLLLSKLSHQEQSLSATWEWYEFQQA